MITKETANRIWCCYREIEAAQQILLDMAEAAKAAGSGDAFAPQLNDVFGRRRDLQLGVPSGDSSHRLFGVRPDLATSIIRAHIADKQSELVRMNEVAAVELRQESQGILISDSPGPIERCDSLE